MTLVDKETNRTLTAITNENGVYAFNALAPRPYTLEVELTGFKKAVLQDVQIRGEQANTVDVTARGRRRHRDGQRRRRGAADRYRDRERRRHRHRPSRFRRCRRRDVTCCSCCSSRPARSGPARATRAAPRTCRARRSAASGAATGIFATENGGQIVANGARTGENNYQIDGVGVTSVSWGGTTVITPNEDAIKEVKVITNNYDAENGRYRGAQVQIISQNGTNDLRGSAFFKVNRPGLNAFQNYNGYGRAVQKDTALYNDIGGTVGGPILRNKLFGFFSYETIRNDAASIVQGWYQTPQYMALAARPGSAAERFLTFPGSSPAAGTVLMGAGDSHGCGDIGLVEGVNCRFIEGQGLDIGRPLNSSFALGTRDPSHVDRFTPGLGGDGTNSPSNLDGVPDLQWRANINPIEEQGRAVQPARRLQRHGEGSRRVQHVPRAAEQRFVQRLRARDERVPSHAVERGGDGDLEPRLLADHAERSARQHRRLELEGSREQPRRPVGAAVGLHPARRLERTLGTIPDGDNHLDFGIGAPGLFDQKTIGVKNTLTKVMKSHTIKMGGEITRHDVRRHRAVVGAAVLLLQQHVGLPERRADGRERHVRSAHRRADRFQEGHAADAVRAVRPGRLEGALEPDADRSACAGSASDRSPRRTTT